MVTTAIYKVLSIYLYIPSHVTTGSFPLVGLEVSETGRKKFFLKRIYIKKKEKFVKSLRFHISYVLK